MPTALVNGIEIYYEVVGEGEPLLLLAGFTCDHSVWLPVVPHLVGRHRVILMDNRGSGRSSAPDEPYTIRQMADDAAGLLDHLGVSRADIAGHSMGGQIAQELTLAYPERVRALLLLSTWLTSSGAFAAVIDSLGRLAGQIDPATVSRVSGAWVFTDGLLDTLARHAATGVDSPPPMAPPHAAYRQSQAILANDTAGRAGSIRVPTLVAVSRQDILTPVRLSEAVARAIPTAELVVLNAGGHANTVEAPEAVAGAISRFLGPRDG